MSRKNRSPEEQARRAKIRKLLQARNISSMDDIQNLFKETFAEFMENGLESELMSPEQQKILMFQAIEAHSWYNRCKESGKNQAKSLHLEDSYVSLQ